MMENKPAYIDCGYFAAPLLPVNTDYTTDIHIMVFNALQEAEGRRIAEKRKERPTDEKN